MELSNADVIELPLPAGPVADLAPVTAGDRPAWLVLGADGRIGRWDPAGGAFEHLATTALDPEAGAQSWAGHSLHRRLHATADGAFAAVVNDYGRFGEVLDLRTGQVTMTLDNNGYHEETVPFSLAFTRQGGRDVVVHRTAWNRLDASVAATGEPLTARPVPGTDEPHYLDHFHGALYVSPDGRRILDDGWVWHPVGVPTVWGLERWLTVNPWESDDGPTRSALCGRDYYWDEAIVWIDDTRVAIGGLGDDDEGMQAGARIFDTTNVPREVAFAGPTGRFFSDGTHLFSADTAGLHGWDVTDGRRLATVAGFAPTHHHRPAGQFLEVGAAAVRALSFPA